VTRFATTADCLLWVCAPKSRQTSAKTRAAVSGEFRPLWRAGCGGGNLAGGRTDRRNVWRFSRRSPRASLDGRHAGAGLVGHKGGRKRLLASRPAAKRTGARAEGGRILAGIRPKWKGRYNHH